MRGELCFKLRKEIVNINIGLSIQLHANVLICSAFVILIVKMREIKFKRIIYIYGDVFVFKGSNYTKELTVKISFKF